MTILAAPSANQIQSTLTASYTRGTDTTLTVADGSGFPSPTPLGHVIWVRDTLVFTASTKWCLLIYTTRATNTLTMGGGATDYALAKNVTVGDEAYEWPIGSYVELVCAADEIAQIFNTMVTKVGTPANDQVGVYTGDGTLEGTADLTFASNQLVVLKTAIGATPGDYGYLTQNTTAAAAGAQQYSPAIRWRGYGWKTDATAASQSVDFRAFVRPIQGAAAPTGGLDFQSSINGGAYSDLVTILSSGNVGIGTTAPIYNLDIGKAGGSYMNLHLSRDNTDTGAYIHNDSDNNVWFSGGAANAGSWVAKATSAEIIGGYNGLFQFYTDTGLTPGAALSPTLRMEINEKGCVGIGTSTWDGTAAGCFAIANGTEPAAHTDNQFYIYSKDSTAGGATIGLYTESAVAVIGTFTPSHKFYTWINGVEYAIQLDAV